MPNRCHRPTPAGALFALALLPALAEPAQAAETRCEIAFEFLAENEVGSIAPGERLTGSIAFSVRSSLRQGAETVSYLAEGRMRVAAEGRGAVEGRVGVVHVIRTPYTADYISIDASKVAGDLGGERSYADPMLLTLYAAPGTLESSDIPRSEADWNALDKRRVFQVHTPTATEAFFGSVDRLTGSCR